MELSRFLQRRLSAIRRHEQANHSTSMPTEDGKGPNERAWARASTKSTVRTARKMSQFLILSTPSRHEGFLQDHGERHICGQRTIYPADACPGTVSWVSRKTWEILERGGHEIQRYASMWPWKQAISGIVHCSLCQPAKTVMIILPTHTAIHIHNTRNPHPSSILCIGPCPSTPFTSS